MVRSILRAAMDTKRLAQNIASGDRARDRMRRTGVTPSGHALWEPPEAGSLRMGYPNYSKVLAQVRRRTRAAAHSKASRMGITVRRAAPWNAEVDKPRMRKLYPSAPKPVLLHAFPGRSWNAIAAKARSWGFARERRHFWSRGNPLVDSLVLKALERNLSITDLDQMGRSRGFFSRRHDRLSRHGLAVVLRAAREMGAVVRARW